MTDSEEQERINAEIKKSIGLLKEEYELRQTINASYDDFINVVRDYSKIQKSIELVNNQIAKQTALIKELQNDTTEEAKKRLQVEKGILENLKNENNQFIARSKIMKEAIADADKLKMTLSKGAAGALKALASFPSLLTKGLSEIRGLGLFDMDSAIKKSALSMGLVDKQAASFSANIQAAANETAMIGVGVKELTKIQSDYSQELGRAVQLDKESLTSLGQMAAATGLGAEGTAQMAADMEQQGISAKETANFVEKTMQDAHEMGLNATKVVGLVAKNVKLLNQYQFKDGIKGLEKMAKVVSKLGVDMKFAAGFADKVMDIEGAVDMSAQLQVMGGAFAKLSDPFHLMYMARNDLAGLTEELGKAAESSVHFNDKSGLFEVSAMEMHKLKIIAQETGVSYEELVQAGKNAAKYTRLKGQISLSAKDEETREFISNMAIIGPDGKATILVGSSPKLLSQLTDSDVALLKDQKDRKQSLEQYAEQARTFDEGLAFAIDRLKIAFIPFIEELDKNLIPKLETFIKSKEFAEFIESTKKIAGVVVKLIEEMANFVAEHPGWTIVGYLFPKIAGVFFNAISWIKSGMDLATGFQLGMGGKGGWLDAAKQFFKFGKGGTGTTPPAAGTTPPAAGTTPPAAGTTPPAAGGVGSSLSTTGKALKIGGGALGGVITGGIDSIDAFSQGKTGEGIGNIAGGVIGGALGTFLDGFLGPFGTILGAQAGSFIGGKIGGLFDTVKTEPVGDGIIKGGKITPIDSKDDILAAKPGGPIDKTIGTSQVNEIKHTFGDLNITGNITISTPGGGTVNSDLLKNPAFVREITLMVTNETQKINNGKHKG